MRKPSGPECGLTHFGSAGLTTGRISEIRNPKSKFPLPTNHSSDSAVPSPDRVVPHSTVLRPAHKTSCRPQGEVEGNQGRLARRRQ